MLTRYIERGIIPLSEREGIGQVVFSPLAQGVLTGKYKPGAPPPQGSRATDPNASAFMTNRGFMSDQRLAAVQRLQKVAEEGGYKLSQLALAWVLRQPNISSAIIGASRPEQISENVQAVDIQLSEELLQRIEAVLEGVVSY
jgi:aryl-alcohol dehydrogenase-like predicted oxidoreductase